MLRMNAALCYRQAQTHASAVADNRGALWRSIQPYRADGNFVHQLWSVAAAAGTQGENSKWIADDYKMSVV